MAEIPEDDLYKLAHQFLVDFKALIYEQGLLVKDRQLNKQHLLELGLTATQREEIVLSLSVLDYNSGPIKDEYKTGDYWVFGKHIDGTEVYIKLKIAEHHGTEQAVCFSFHKSEHPLRYPFA
ncbi:MAG: toxin [Anaerolineae bacterium]|jgi:hypothetical protein|nr:toxin [Anaerolineae bacterium]